MTQEEKQLLLQDLCARLPYHPLLAHQNNSEIKGSLIQINSSELIISPWGKYNIEECKPYLRPMSSMTEEEREEIKEICADYLDEWENAETVVDRWKLDAKASYLRSKFYNSHHFDWNGLIDKGLALEAPDGMYVIK